MSALRNHSRRAASSGSASHVRQYVGIASVQSARLRNRGHRLANGQRLASTQASPARRRDPRRPATPAPAPSAPRVEPPGEDCRKPSAKAGTSPASIAAKIKACSSARSSAKRTASSSAGVCVMALHSAQGPRLRYVELLRRPTSVMRRQRSGRLRVGMPTGALHCYLLDVRIRCIDQRAAALGLI